MSARSRSQVPAAIHVRIGRVVVDGGIVDGGSDLGAALSGRIATRLEGAEARPLPTRRPLVDTVADAVDAAVAPHITGIRRG